MTILKDTIDRRAAVVLAILLAGTIASWQLGSDHALFENSRAVAGALVLGVAFAKVYLVGAYFMELREAPRAMLAAFAVWCAVVCAALIATYAV